MRTRLVVLATGGTIAGSAASAADNLGYRSAALPVDALLAGIPTPSSSAIETEQVAQLDSKDVDETTWQRLARRARDHLARPEVAGIVVTHGTDTLEETAWFLQRTLAPAKPLVLTAAMRPASSLQSDGPQNLSDALAVAADGRVAGVTAVLGGAVWPARGLRKLHPYRLDAFAGPDAGPLAWVREGRLMPLRPGAAPAPADPALLELDPAAWPRVAMLASHAGADGDLVDAAVHAGYRGIVVAATGHATVHRRVEAALERARARGVAVWVASRCTASDGVPPLPGASDPRWFTPAQARVELLVRLAATP
ncbi:MAG: asparaginase [Ideonella sp.]|jgi:L-asparaginase|nr:asparaginase [Ideonella sp.]